MISTFMAWMSFSHWRLRIAGRCGSPNAWAEGWQEVCCAVPIAAMQATIRDAAIATFEEDLRPPKAADATDSEDAESTLLEAASTRLECLEEAKGQKFGPSVSAETHLMDSSVISESYNAVQLLLLFARSSDYWATCSSPLVESFPAVAGTYADLPRG